MPAESLAADFGYRGREWRLRNAARDSARLSLSMLRQSLEILAQADGQLKSARTDKRVVLEQPLKKEETGCRGYGKPLWWRENTTRSA